MWLWAVFLQFHSFGLILFLISGPFVVIGVVKVNPNLRQNREARMFRDRRERDSHHLWTPVPKCWKGMIVYMTSIILSSSHSLRWLRVVEHTWEEIPSWQGWNVLSPVIMISLVMFVIGFLLESAEECFASLSYSDFGQSQSLYRKQQEVNRSNKNAAKKGGLEIINELRAETLLRRSLWYQLQVLCCSTGSTGTM